MSLARKAIGGVFWVSLSAILIKIINFAITVILARLLEPVHFGLVALGLIVVNFFEVFRDLGIGASLIYKKEDIDSAANTAFFIFPTAALLFYILSYFISPFLAAFFMEEELVSIIRALSLIFVIWSFGALPRTLLEKNLEFKKMIIPQILPKLGYGGIAIWMALQGFGVWSLVGGRLSLEILSVITYWSATEWRPNFKFNRYIALELIQYGKHVVGANIIFFLISITDTTFIGRLLGTQSLGYYSIAFGIAGLLTIQVSNLLREVTFPMYSKLQGDKNALKKAYLRTMKYLSIVATPASIGIFAIAESFIKVIYGDKWLPAVGALQILCFYGLSSALTGVTSSLYFAAGKPKISVKLNFLKLTLILLLIYPLTLQYGILGTSIAVTIPSIFVFISSLKEAGEIIDERFSYIAKTLVPGAIGSIIMVFIIAILKYVASSFPSIVLLISSITLGGTVYLAFLWLAQREILQEMTRLIAASIAY